MPQFDTFSFLSQITWVFFSFGLIYLSICYCISPTIATILKVRSLKQLSGNKGGKYEHYKVNLLNNLQQSCNYNANTSLFKIFYHETKLSTESLKKLPHISSFNTFINFFETLLINLLVSMSVFTEIHLFRTAVIAQTTIRN